MPVSGGAGSISFKAIGKIQRVIITAPSGTPTYTYTINDSKTPSNAIAGGNAASGPLAATQNNFDPANAPCTGTLTFFISSATVDGNYAVMIYGEGYDGDWTYQ